MEAVQRLPFATPKTGAFDVLEEMELLRPGHKLHFAGDRRFHHTGPGLLPYEYWLAEDHRLLKRAGTVDAVLLDTPGLSPRDAERLDELARELARTAAPCELHTWLVLSTTASRGALRLTTRAFAGFRAEGAVLTKLDETDEPAAACEALVRARLPLAFLCDGQDARAHLVRPGPDGIADLVLRGHVAGGPSA
jgi:flagellar biosynthesis GTPase FlhF